MDSSWDAAFEAVRNSPHTPSPISAEARAQGERFMDSFLRNRARAFARDAVNPHHVSSAMSEMAEVAPEMATQGSAPAGFNDYLMQGRAPSPQALDSFPFRGAPNSSYIRGLRFVEAPPVRSPNLPANIGPEFEPPLSAAPESIPGDFLPGFEGAGSGATGDAVVGGLVPTAEGGLGTGGAMEVMAGLAASPAALAGVGLGAAGDIYAMQGLTNEMSKGDADWHGRQNVQDVLAGGHHSDAKTALMGLEMAGQNLSKTKDLSGLNSAIVTGFKHANNMRKGPEGKGAYQSYVQAMTNALMRAGLDKAMIPHLYKRALDSAPPAEGHGKVVGFIRDNMGGGLGRPLHGLHRTGDLTSAPISNSSLLQAQAEADAGGWAP